MQTFLNQKEATFYHVTTIENWKKIRITGLNSKRIFVSRIGEFPVLLSIALEQLPEIYETGEIVFLKLPQEKNQFLPEEIKPDLQACVEWTQPFQNIILRDYIPIENIELMMIIKLGEEPNRTFILNYLTNIANSGKNNYENHFVTYNSTQIIY